MFCTECNLLGVGNQDLDTDKDIPELDTLVPDTLVPDTQALDKELGTDEVLDAESVLVSDVDLVAVLEMEQESETDAGSVAVLELVLPVVDFPGAELALVPV